MNKLIKKISIVFVALALMCSFSIVNSNAATKYDHYVTLESGYGFSFFINQSGATRYCTNSIYKTSSSTTSGGTCLTSKSGSYANNSGSQVDASLSGISHAYGKGVIYKGSAYQSGVSASSAKIIK